MLKLVTSNKVVDVKEKNEWIYMHPEVEIGMSKIHKWLKKKAQDKETYTVFSFNPILFRIGLLLKLQGEKVSFGYIDSRKTKVEEVAVDDMGYFVNAPIHFMDLMEKVQDEIREIRRQRKYE